MISVTGRTAGWVVLTLSLLALAALVVVGAVSNRVTGHEALGMFIAVMVAAVAALWLRRDKHQRRPQ